MSKIPLSIEIVISTNKSLSSMGFDSRRDIEDILSKKYSDVRITDVNTRHDLDQVIARKPDLVFLGMKFILSDQAGEPTKIWLNQELKTAGIPYTGSGGNASKLEYNKHLAKEQITRHGLATASSQLIRQGGMYTDKDIEVSYPIFIKPVDGGGGSGINEFSLARDFDELQRQVSWLFATHQTDILLESYLPGREFSVGLLRKQDNMQFNLLPLEIIAPKNQSGARFLSSQIKQDDVERALEVTDLVLKSKLNELALSVFDALDARDYGRIDIRLDAHGSPSFIEANLMPGLSSHGYLSRSSFVNKGITHDDLILRIADLALPRHLSQRLPIHSSLVPTTSALNFVS